MGIILSLGELVGVWLLPSFFHHDIRDVFLSRFDAHWARGTSRFSPCPGIDSRQRLPAALPTRRGGSGTRRAMGFPLISYDDRLSPAGLAEGSATTCSSGRVQMRSLRSPCNWDECSHIGLSRQARRSPTRSTPTPTFDIVQPAGELEF